MSTYKRVSSGGQTGTYSEKLDWYRNLSTWLILGVVIANLVILTVGLLGAASTGEMMKKTTMSTIKMSNKTDKAEKDIRNYIVYLTEGYPDDYDKDLFNQVTNTVENVHQITARTRTLLENLTPVMFDSLVGKIENIITRVHELSSNADPEQSAQIIRSATRILEKTDALLTSVTPAEFQLSVRNFNLISENVNNVLQAVHDADAITKMTEFLDNTNALEQKIRELHELRVSLP